MIFDPASWPRPRYVAGGGDALVALEVCGEFPTQIPSDFALEDLEISVETNDSARFVEAEAQMLRDFGLDALNAIVSAPQVVSIRGLIPDPPDLEYLRRTLGFIHELLQNGGIGVLDPQTLQFWAPLRWENTFWSGAFEPTSHAMIVFSVEGEKIWLRTCGMRLFGRPDLSCHGVLPVEVELLQPVFNGLIRMQAAGALITDGQKVQAVGIENRLICRPRGGLDDDDFNNFHLELEWETPRP